MQDVANQVNMPMPTEVGGFHAEPPKPPASSEQAIMSQLMGGRYFSQVDVECSQTLIGFCEQTEFEITSDNREARAAHGAYMDLEEWSKSEFADIPVPVVYPAPPAPPPPPPPAVEPAPAEYELNDGTD